MATNFEEDAFKINSNNSMEINDTEDEIKAIEEENKVEDPFALDMAMKTDNDEELKEDIPEITEDDIFADHKPENKLNEKKQNRRSRKKKNVDINEENDEITDIPEIPNTEEIINLIFGEPSETLDLDEKEFEDLDQRSVTFITEAKQTIKKILTIVKRYGKHKLQNIYDELDEDLESTPKSQKRKRKRSAESKQSDKPTEEELDLMASTLVDTMNNACEEDRQNNKERRMALRKLEILPEVMDKLSKVNLREKLIQHGVLSVIRKWLEPLPDKTIPNIKIREGMLKILDSMPPLSEYVIKQSGIGRIVMFVAKTDPERHIAQLAKSIIDKWSKQIFELHDTYSIHESYSPRRPQQSPVSAKLKEKKFLASNQNNNTVQITKGKTGRRARVPDNIAMDFVYRPESNIVETNKSKTPGYWESMFSKKAKKSSSKSSSLGITKSKRLV